MSKLSSLMHFIGKLIAVKLKFPLKSFLPTDFNNSVATLLNLAYNSLSLSWNPP